MRRTMDDVAREVGVSKSTVSRALAGDPRVRLATRLRIEQAAAQLGYSRHRVATALARGRTWMLGVATPDAPRSFSDPFYLEFLGGLGDRAMRAGYNLVVAAPPGLEGAEGVDLASLVAGRVVDGVVLTEPAVDDPRLALLRGDGMPFVFLGTCEEGGAVPPDVSFVDGDNLGGARRAVEHLIELGHRRIGCVAGPSHLVTTQRRLEGYRQGLAAAGLPLVPAWIVEGDFTQEGGRRAMEVLLGRGASGPEGPTGVFCCNDLMAVGALAAVREAGLQVPRDLSIVGFDGVTLAALVDPPITTVEQPIHRLGELVAGVLLEQIPAQVQGPVQRRVEGRLRGANRARAGRPAWTRRRQLTVPCRLAVRGSTAPPGR